MSVVGHDHVNDFADAPGIIKCSIHVANWDWLGQLAGWKFHSGDEILVNEISSGTGIDHGFHGCFFHSVCHLQMDREHNAFRIQLEGMDDKLALYQFFPFGLAQSAGFNLWECWCLRGFLCVVTHIHCFYKR